MTKYKNAYTEVYAILEQLDEEEYNQIKEIIDKNTQLHLTDNNESGKLLGIQLDLKYDE